jgi:hypothetical protein
MNYHDSFQACNGQLNALAKPPNAEVFHVALLQQFPVWVDFECPILPLVTNIFLVQHGSLIDLNKLVGILLLL